MRYTAQHKSQTRSRILSAAARRIRIEGPDQLGVAAVMSDIGLTPGGFYAHFESKDDLIAKVIDAMFDEALDKTRAMDLAVMDVARDLRHAVRAYLTSYVSAEHRDDLENGCPLPALSSDMARASGVARTHFVDGVDRFASRIEAVLIRMGATDAWAEAHGILATMAGGVGLARAVGKGPQSDSILRNTLDTLLEKLDL